MRRSMCLLKDMLQRRAGMSAIGTEGEEMVALANAPSGLLGREDDRHFSCEGRRFESRWFPCGGVG